MTKWQHMQEFLDFWKAAGYKTFTNHDVAHMLSMSPSSASELIDAYTEAITKPNCDTKHHIWREGRTANAVWNIGHSVKDLRAMSAQFANDIEHRIDAAFLPFVNHILEHNPKALPNVLKSQREVGKILRDLENLGH